MWSLRVAVVRGRETGRGSGGEGGVCVWGDEEEEAGVEDVISPIAALRGGVGGVVVKRKGVHFWEPKIKIERN